MENTRAALKINVVFDTITSFRDYSISFTTKKGNACIHITKKKIRGNSLDIRLFAFDLTLYSQPVSD